MEKENGLEKGKRVKGKRKGFRLQEWNSNCPQEVDEHMIIKSLCKYVFLKLETVTKDLHDD